MAAERSESTERVRAALEVLRAHRDDLHAAAEAFAWPELETFNWGLEWFDVLASEAPDRPALTIVEEGGSVGSWSYGQMSARSDQVATWLRSQGVGRGDRIVLMLGNQVELWEVVLASIKLGSVLIPASTLLTPGDLQDRIDRGGARFAIARSADAGTFAAVDGDFTKIAVGGAPEGWVAYADSRHGPTAFAADGPTPATDTTLLYFTSGTTALPKLVEHTHVSYPVGHLSTAYWIGLQPGDVHLNISSPGWAKHAWSNVFAPWLAGATVFMYNYTRFDAAALMQVMQTYGVTTFCAPPTVWRMLIQADLSVLRTPPREVVGAGEPLNPEVIERIRQAWGVTIRDGFGQTECTLAVANTPGRPVKDGSMGRPLPGYQVVLLDPDGREVEGVGEGEIGFRLDPHPLGLSPGYFGDAELTAEKYRDGYYRTGDVAARDADDYLTYVGRADDVFKSSDYRLSPFELESVLIEHPAVAEAAVIPSPDPLRLSVPKAFVVLAAGWTPDEQTAAEILQFAAGRLAPYKRIRRIEFSELPKTISGKIRRVELRQRDAEAYAAGTPDGEFREQR